MRIEVETPHLNDQELFELALPPAGEPEPLPRHLSECLECSRALQAWKTAVRELAQEDADVIERRSARDWQLREEKTLDAIRRTRRIRPRMRWAIAVAATFVLAAFLLPLRRAPIPAALPAVSELSAQDQADDALLRDVARLTRAEDSESGWSALAPEPSQDTPGQGDEL